MSLSTQAESAHLRYDFAEIDAAILRAVDEAARQGQGLTSKQLASDVAVRRACRMLSDQAHRGMFGKPRPEQFMDKRLRYLLHAGLLQQGAQGWKRP